MFLYIHHVGVAHKGHIVTGPRGRIAAETYISARVSFQKPVASFFDFYKAWIFPPSFGLHFSVPNHTFRLLFMWLFSGPWAEFTHFGTRFCSGVLWPVLETWKWAHLSKQTVLPGEHKTETAQTSCINMNAEVFQMFFFYLINLVTTFKWSKTHIAL